MSLETAQSRAWLAIRDPALRALWVEALAARGMLAVAPGSGEAALAVFDAEALAQRAGGERLPYTVGVAADPSAAQRLLEGGADDACVATTAELVALRLDVALRVAAAPPPGPARQLAQLTAMMRGVSAAALRLRDRQELLAATCRLALEHGLRDALVFMLEPDRRTLRLVASAHNTPEEAPALAVATQALGGSRPSTHDLMDAATRGNAELLALPLRRSSRPIGVLVLRVGPSMASSFRPLLEDLAAALSLALELIDEEARRRAVVATLRSRERRQAALAHLGARALEVTDTAALMGELAALTAETVDSDFCRLLRVDPAGEKLLPLASHGLPPGSPEPRLGTPGGQALQQREPVLVERYADERRFLGGGLEQAGAVAGVHVVVPHPQGSWGVLEVGRRAPVRFTDDDVHFIQTCAALLGHALARFEASEALRRSEATFRTLIDAMPVAINVVAGGRYVYVNERAVQMLGFSAEQLLAMGPADLVVPSDLPEVQARHQQTLESGVPNPPVHLRSRRADGSIALLESVSMGIPFDGRPAVVGISLDIGERQLLREKLVLAERLSAVGTLAAGVAHEINNPLAYVIGNLSYLSQELTALRGELPPGTAAEERAGAMAQALDEAREGSQRVRHIVGDLKTFSRTDDERRGAVDINALVDSSVNIALSEIRHRARLVRTAGPVPPVQASPGRLGQLFLNLLVNAAQAIPEGKPGMEVRVVTRTDARGHAVVEISDTGVGIPAEVRPRIFDPFFTTKPVGVGTGLGLSICHGIITRLGGELQVESEVGVGSCFRVVLPAGAAAAEAPPVERTVGPGQPGRVLVIDDEPLVGAIIARALTPPHTVVRELSAHAALSRLDAGERFDLILCDLLMPGMTGMDLHAELLARRPEQAERLLFLSGGAFTPRAQAFLEDPAHVCLEKPFDVDRLRAVVREQLERLPPA